MAKKKQKKGPAQTHKVSPLKYLREKGRSLPVYKCYLNKDWQEAGMATIIISRLRPDGRYVGASYLVDTFCLGVKDAYVCIDLEEDDLKDWVDRHSESGEITEVSYPEVHNLILGAIEFAEEGGVTPCKEYETEAQYLLSEDTEDIPLIEYEYGYKGKHLLIDNGMGDSKWIHTLEENLGDMFEYDGDYDDDDEFYDEDFDDDDYEFYDDDEFEDEDEEFEDDDEEDDDEEDDDRE